MQAYGGRNLYLEFLLNTDERESVCENKRNNPVSNLVKQKMLVFPNLNMLNQAKRDLTMCGYKTSIMTHEREERFGKERSDDDVVKFIKAV